MLVAKKTDKGDCMMKSIVDENLVSFKMLEQKIYDYVCELGRLITQQVLESYDAKLAESRDKKTYRGKGKWSTDERYIAQKPNREKRHMSICWMKPCKWIRLV